MNLEHLQDRFGIAGRLGFAQEQHGLTRVDLKHASGACAEVYLHGAHVAGWRTSRGLEMLFLSRASCFRDGMPIRGGIPVIFPQFGDGPLPKHGLARTRAWQVERTALDADGAVTITLQLEDDAQTRALWPHRFRLQLQVALAETLTIEFTVTNTGPDPFLFQTSLHTYFQVGDIALTGLRGLRGTEFNDFLCPGPALAETREAVAFDCETDRLYINAPDRVVLEDRLNKRAIAIAKSGMDDVVVWNPWIEKSGRLEDFGADEYRRMVCVETGNMRAPAVLAPGGHWVGRTTFTCEKG